MSHIATHPQGRSFPLGPTVYPEGVNLSVFSKHATGVELLRFDHIDDLEPSRLIQLASQINRTYHYWHVFVPGLKVGQLYGFRVHGPFEPERGLRFNPTRVLLDPYGKCIARPAGYRRDAMHLSGDSAVPSMKSVIAEPGADDWDEDTPPNIPFVRSVIYEMHVGGFTRHPNSGVAPVLRGTYAGLIEKIPYLRDLGVNAVELLPVYAFDEQDAFEGLFLPFLRWRPCALGLPASLVRLALA